MGVKTQLSEPSLDLPASRPRPTRGELEVKGKLLSVPMATVLGHAFVVTGKWLRVASLRHEELVEKSAGLDPREFAHELKQTGLKADLLTIAQKIPEVEPRFKYLIEWENVAAIPVTTYEHWWKELAEYSIRKAVNKAKRLGVVARVVRFDDDFVRATCAIYNETAVRQGKTFWHYGKQFQTIKHSLDTYVDRSTFIGAYLDDELIGFMKITWVDQTGTITQILSMKRHFDKRPNNAMIAKAVELCAQRGASHFIYGSFVYHDPNSSLTEFKRRNGFQQINLPRFYVPLTMRGKIALALGWHRGLIANTPKPIARLYLRLRRFWLELKSKTMASASPASAEQPV
jgi:hypothetical protein